MDWQTDGQGDSSESSHSIWIQEMCKIKYITVPPMVQG